MFPHPNPTVRLGKNPMPVIFEQFPNLEASVKSFMIENLSNFSIEMLRAELAAEMLPKLAEECKKDDGYEQHEGYILVQHYIATLPSYSTVLRWVKRIGFTHCNRTKSYMVDGHEHDEQK